MVSARKPSAEFSASIEVLQRSEHLGVVTCSPERVIRANDAYLKMIGFTRDEMEGGLIDWRAITTPNSLIRDDQAIIELRDHGTCLPFEKEYVLRDGTRLPVLLGAVRYSTDPFEWICWVTDLRPQKEVEWAEQKARKLQLEAELRGAKLIYDISNRLLIPSSVPDLLTEILDAAIQLTEADFGNLQLPDHECYRIVAQRGFSSDFLAFFNDVRDGSTTVCGAALKQGRRVIIPDVSSDELFSGTAAREILLREGVRAVQSTPLIGTSGEVYGVLSTHFRRPGRPSERALRFLDLLAGRAGQILQSVQLAEVHQRNEGLRASGRLANSLAHEINNPIQALTNIMTLLSQEEEVGVAR
jgi:hypothetical protein